jgi:hypothetical protein
MKKNVLVSFVLGLLLLCLTGTAGAVTVTMVSDSSTLFSASGTDDLSTMNNAVLSGTYSTPNLPVVVASQGTGIYTIPGTAIVNSNPSAYYSGLSGYYQTSFVLPSGFSSITLNVQAVGDDGGYVYLNGVCLGAFWWNGSTAYSFSVSDSSLFHTGTNLLTFAVSNCGGGPTGLSYSAVVNYDVSAVPLPASLFLFAPGLVSLAGIRRKLKK